MLDASAVVVPTMQLARLPGVQEIEQEQAAAAFEASWSAYMQEASRLDMVLGAQLTEKKPIHHRQVIPCWLHKSSRSCRLHGFKVPPTWSVHIAAVHQQADPSLNRVQLADSLDVVLVVGSC